MSKTKIIVYGAIFGMLLIWSLVLNWSQMIQNNNIAQTVEGQRQVIQQLINHDLNKSNIIY